MKLIKVKRRQNVYLLREEGETQFWVNLVKTAKFILLNPTQNPPKLGRCDFRSQNPPKRGRCDFR